ncbi:hypothetical protein LHFGNBLO_002057 [Mesorhizobium sp. AR10]|uniref:hypothetical protein n=1 Tax=Mesorhizobium sp. AR10 TaxID=2865839 RepID=UPI002160D29F|nr:hypothetical protein [Mesorhizobium sp. AR10]UVK40575.1 hypothetical protein LHFGNBLO_002057 [Mesorhizobium sp. AR10]
MKRKKRDPEKFDPVELFTAIGRDRGYKINADGDIDDFLGRVGRSLKASQTNLILLHGKRVEALFAHAAGALGKCRMIKQEDCGSLFIDGDEVEIPDYRMILKDGTSYLIEVKNFHMKDFKSEFKIPKKSIRKLEAYAGINGLPLRIAAYFSNPGVWVLLPSAAFRETKNHFVIGFADAMARNEMATLGDRTIATLPDLRIEFHGDPDECFVPDDSGQVRFTTRRIKIYCRNQEVADGDGKEIAFYLMRHGNWPEQYAHAMMDEGKVVGVRFGFSPRSPVEDQDLQIIGALSTMVSSAYGEMTVGESSILALDVQDDPDVFSLRIPEGFKDQALPLWQFTLQPNYNIKKSAAN